MACVVITSLLTVATLRLTLVALGAIEEAASSRITKEALDLTKKQSAPVAAGLGIDPDDLAEAIESSKDGASQLDLTPAQITQIAEKTGVSEAELRTELAEAKAAATVQETTSQRESRQNQALVTLAWACLGVVLLFGLKYTFTRGQVYYLSKASHRLASDLRERLFDKLMRLPVAYFNNRRTGEIQSIVSNDVNVYQTAVNVIRDSIDGPIKAIGALIFVFWMQPFLGLLALMFVPLLAFIVNRTGKRIKAAQTEIQQDLAAVTALSQEALSGTRVIKAFSAEDRIKNIFERAVEKQYQSQLRGARRVASLRPTVEFMGAVAIALIMYACGHLAKASLLNISQIIVIVQALDLVNQGFKSITNVTSTYNQVQAAVERIHTHVLDVPDERTDNPDAVVVSAPQGRIEFRNVSFAYADGTQALSNVSFVLEPGESLALVGPSGAGKSTIADLVLRFYDPTSGEILFDGVDYRQLKIAWLRDQFGVVPQQTFLFAGTIEENLKLGNPDATPEIIGDACRMANAQGFIDQSPDGLQTELGERGVRLSGGELQRLAIARALVSEPKVLILDEATSNLDAMSEKLVTEALDKVMHERTTLFIAHRLTTAARATRILVLRRGEVLELGSHEELMQKNDVYAGMVRAFSGGVLDDGLG